jgi:hypothetical protein
MNYKVLNRGRVPRYKQELYSILNILAKDTYIF